MGGLAGSEVNVVVSVVAAVRNTWLVIRRWKQHAAVVSGCPSVSRSVSDLFLDQQLLSYTLRLPLSISSHNVVCLSATIALCSAFWYADCLWCRVFPTWLVIRRSRQQTAVGISVWINISVFTMFMFSESYEGTCGEQSTLSCSPNYFLTYFLLWYGQNIQYLLLGGTLPAVW